MKPPQRQQTKYTSVTGKMSQFTMPNEMYHWMARTGLSCIPYETKIQLAECLDGYHDTINPITFGERMGLPPATAEHVAKHGKDEYPTISILRVLGPTNKTVLDAYLVLRGMNSRGTRVLEDLWSETCQARDCGTMVPRSVDANSEPSSCGCGQCYNDLNVAPSLSSGSSNSGHGCHGINIPPSPLLPSEDHTEVKGRSPASGDSTQCSEFFPPEDFSDTSQEEAIESLRRFGGSSDNEDLHLAQPSNPVPQHGREGPKSFPLGLQQQHRNVPASKKTYHSLPTTYSNLPGLEQSVCQGTAVFCPPCISREPPPQVRVETELLQRSVLSPERTTAAAVPTPRAEFQRQTSKGSPAKVRKKRVSQDKFVLIVCGEKHWSDAHEEAVQTLLDTLQNNAIPYVACSPRRHPPWSWSPETLVSKDVIMQNKSLFLHKVFKEATAIIPVITREVQRYVEPRSQKKSFGEARENAIYIFHSILDEISKPMGNTRFFPLIMNQLGASSRHNFDWLGNTVVYHFSVEVQRRDLLKHVTGRLNP